MAGIKSKNSRTSAPGQPKGQIIGDMKIVVSCNGGRNAYVFNMVTGTNPNVPTGSEEFTELVRANTAAGFGDRQRAEIADLAAARPDSAWPSVLARLDSVGAFA